MKSVTIRVKPGTRDYLRETCREKETYDDVINRLIIEDAKAQDELRAWREFERSCEEDDEEAEKD